jgi:ABC-type multidrug transport system fused ATPase/permease subunit
MIAILVNLPALFVRHFRAFRRLTGNHMFALVALTTLMSYAEGIGIALFFPLFESGGEADALSAILHRVLRVLHVTPTPTGVLPLIVSAFLLKGVLQFATLSYQGYLVAQVTLRLRRELVSGLHRLDYRAVIGRNAGFDSNLLANQVSTVGTGFTWFVRLFPSAISVIVFFCIVIVLNWRLTLLCVLMGLCAVAVLAFTGRIAERQSAAHVRESSLLSMLLVPAVQAFKYLRATGRFGTLREKIDASARRAASADARSAAAAALSLALPQPLMVMFLAALLYYRSAIQHQPFGSLFVLLLYFVRIMSELWTLQFNWQMFVGCLAPIDLVSSVLQTFERSAEVSGVRPYVVSPTEIRLRDVSFSYVDGRPILRNIDLGIAPNSTLALVGESGAGKSTLVDLILGTLKPSSGNVTMNGVALTDLDLETLRRSVGYVPQDAMLFDDTVANNISLWAPVGEQQIRDAARQAHCLELIERMPHGFASPIGDRGIKLSGGQRQRLAIARELLKRPTILVLDEATSALDSESERAIQGSIDTLAGQMTLIIIAHRLSTIRNCDHVCVLYEGQIVEEGSYEQLRRRPDSRFARLCQLQELTRESVA